MTSKKIIETKLSFICKNSIQIDEIFDTKYLNIFIKFACLTLRLRFSVISYSNYIV